MILYGTFKNNLNETISVVFYNTTSTAPDINIDTSDDIRFDSDPVEIKTDCEDSFEVLIKTSARITLVSKRWLGDYLYANDMESIVVNIYNGNDCIFAGYVTPNTFNQDYSMDWNTIDINCVDKLSTLEYKYPTKDTSYDELRAQAQARTFKYLIEKMNIADNALNIGNLPTTNDGTSQWVETGYVINGGTYTAVESNVIDIDSTSAVDTGMKRDGSVLTPTYVQSNETMVGPDGQLYYKKYAYITINNEQVNTGDYIQGDPAPMPYVVDTVNVLIGWTYGPMPQPFDYYDHYRIDNVMSDGCIKEGQNDTIGDRIPETPQTTSEGSYYEFRQGDRNDLTSGEDEHGDRVLYYKNYAWIIQTIDGETVEWKTGDWIIGDPFIPGQ